MATTEQKEKQKRGLWGPSDASFRPLGLPGGQLAL